MKKRTIVLCGLVGLLTPSVVPLSTALAGPVTWEFAGEITRVYDPLDFLGGAVAVGTSFSGSFTFESTTPDSQPDRNQGIYNDFVIAITGEVGGVPFGGPTSGRLNQLRIDNGIGDFQHDLYFFRNGVTLVGPTFDLEFGLLAGNSAALFGDQILLEPPALEVFNVSRFFGISDTSERIPFLLDGRISTLVPDVGTVLLGAVGLALCVLRSCCRGRAIPLCRSVLATVMVTLFSASPALPGPVTWEFPGEITRVYDPLELLGGAVQIGTPFSGYYTFESATPDSQPDRNQGIYNDFVIAISGQVGGVPFFGPTDEQINVLQIDNGREPFGFDHYGLRTGVNFVGQKLDLEFFLFSGDPSVYLSDHIPQAPGLLEDFDLHAGFGISDTSERIPLLLDGRLTMVVPEPHALILILSGLLIRTARRLKKRRLGLSLLATIAMLLSPLEATAADCIGNELIDSTELTQCKVDLVFLMDTSNSMEVTHQPFAMVEPGSGGRFPVMRYARSAAAMVWVGLRPRSLRVR